MRRAILGCPEFTGFSGCAPTYVIHSLPNQSSQADLCVSGPNFSFNKGKLGYVWLVASYFLATVSFYSLGTYFSNKKNYPRCWTSFLKFCSSISICSVVWKPSCDFSPPTSIHNGPHQYGKQNLEMDKNGPKTLRTNFQLVLGFWRFCPLRHTRAFWKVLNLMHIEHAAKTNRFYACEGRSVVRRGPKRRQRCMLPGSICLVHRRVEEQLDLEPQCNLAWTQTKKALDPKVPNTTSRGKESKLQFFRRFFPYKKLGFLRRKWNNQCQQLENKPPRHLSDSWWWLQNVFESDMAIISPGKLEQWQKFYLSTSISAKIGRI